MQHIRPFVFSWPDMRPSCDRMLKEHFILAFVYRVRAPRRTYEGNMLGGHMRKSAGASGDFAIAFVNGPITFRSEEGVLYARLFHIVRRSVCHFSLRVRAAADSMLLLVGGRSIPIPTDTLAAQKEPRSSDARDC